MVVDVNRRTVEVSQRLLKSLDKVKVRLESTCIHRSPEMWIGLVLMGFRSGLKVEVHLMMKQKSQGLADLRSVLGNYSYAAWVNHKQGILVVFVQMDRIHHM